MEGDDLEGWAARVTLLFSILLLDPFSALLLAPDQLDSLVGSSDLWLPAGLGRTSGGGPKAELRYESPDPCPAFLCQMWPLVLSSGGSPLPNCPSGLGGWLLLALGYHTMPCWFSSLRPCLYK